MTRAQNNRIQWVFGQDDAKARLLLQVLVDFPEQRYATGQHDTTLEDITRELRRHSFERFEHGLDDRLDWLGERLSDLGVGDRDGSRQALGQVASLTSIRNGFSSGAADPMSHLIFSAVLSPISRVWVRFMYWMMASSISRPATRSERP